MKSSFFFARAAVVLACLGFAAAGVRGQGVWNYASIYSFGQLVNAGDGSSPGGGVVVSPDGNTLYGTTQTGGKHGQGTVFAFDTHKFQLTTLWDFGNQFGTTDGSHPQGNLVLANGILYGTTLLGGPNGKGVVYCIGADGQNPPYRWLINFAGGADDGSFPNFSGLTLSSDGSILYGLTANGGDNDNGTVFAISINGAGTSYQLLHKFTVTVSNDGVDPNGGLVLSADGQTLYGTTVRGGRNDNGTVFAVSTSGDTTFYHVLHSFAGTANNDGWAPDAGLILSSDGTTLYGTTAYGGDLLPNNFPLQPSVNGTVFALSTSGGNDQLLHSFVDFSQIMLPGRGDGFAPVAGLVLSGKWLYGTTFAGGEWYQITHPGNPPYPIDAWRNSGSVFAVNTSGDGFTGQDWPPPAYSLLYSFTGANTPSTGNDGLNPASSLTYQAATPTIPHPLLYGTTVQGGDNGVGTLFVLTQVTPPTMHILHHHAPERVEVASDDATATYLLQAASSPSGPWERIGHENTVIPYTEPVTNKRYYRVVAFVTNPPVVVTLPATEVSANDAMLNGTVVPDAPFATAWYRYGSDTQYLAGATAKQLVTAYMTNAIAISNALSTLAAGATYHCQLVASNSFGISYGYDQSFTTFAGADVPFVITVGASNVTSTTVTLAGTVNPEGANTRAYFQYGTSIPYESQTSETLVSAVNTNSVGVSNGVAMLLPGTLYFFQLVASNSAGTGYGGDVAFVTPGPPLAETTYNPSVISSTGATLGGYVFPNALDTTAWVEYGLDTNYTGGTSGATVVGASNLAGLAVSSAISGLLANTTYHFQLVASNSLGVSYGGDGSFPTPLGALPVAVTGSASNVTATSALLSGTVNPEGIETMGYFYYYSPQTGAYGFSAPQLVGSGTDPVPFSLMVTGLAPNTLYSFEAAGTNTIGSGAGYGSSVQFTTPGLPADVVTMDATYTNGIPVINGTVNGHGARFLWVFEIGYSPDNYTWVVGNSYATNNSPQLFSVTMTNNPNLFPSTTYYYTLEAYNAWGENNLYTVKSFTTPP